MITVTVNDGGALNATVIQTFRVTIGERIVRVVSQSGMAGMEVSVPIELVSQGNENGVGFSLSFNPTQLQFIRAELGSDAGTATLNVNENGKAQGRVGLGLALPTTLTDQTTFAAGNRQIAVITMAIPIEVSQSTVAQVTFTQVPTFTEVVDRQAIQLPTAFEGGTVTITHGYEGDVAPRPFGNNNGTVSITDWVQVGRFAVGLDTVDNASEFERADSAPREVDGHPSLGNGVISIADWVQAGRYAVGLDPVTPGGGPSGPSLTAQSTHSDSGSVSLKSVLPGRELRRIRAFNRVVTEGRHFLVLIGLDAQGDENALGFSLNYDASAMRFSEARLGGDARSATMLANRNRSDSGRIGLALALPPGETFTRGPNFVVELEFVAFKKGEESNSAIEFVDQPIRRELVDVKANNVDSGYLASTVEIRTSNGQDTEYPPAGTLSVSERMPDGGLFLRLIGEPGRQYVIEASDNLATWESLQTVTFGDGGGRESELADTKARSLPRRFYRVKLAPSE